MSKRELNAMDLFGYGLIIAAIAGGISGHCNYANSQPQQSLWQEFLYQDNSLCPRPVPKLEGTESSLRALIMSDPAYFAKRSDEFGIVRLWQAAGSYVVWSNGDSLAIFQHQEPGTWGSPDGPGYFEEWIFEDGSSIHFFILARTGNPSQMWIPGCRWIAE